MSSTATFTSTSPRLPSRRIATRPWRTSLETVSDVQERYLDVPGLSAGGIGKTGPAFPTGNAGVRIVETPEAMRAELSAIGVDIGILFPDHLLKLPLVSPRSTLPRSRGPTTRGSSTDGALPDGLFGCLVACPQDPEDAAGRSNGTAASGASSACTCRVLGRPLFGGTVAMTRSSCRETRASRYCSTLSP